MNHENLLLRSSDGTPLVLEGVDVRGRVRGLLLDVEVAQRYHNDTGRNLECVYTFPLPFDAVLLDLDVDLGGRHLSAVVVERGEAEQDYEDALDRGDAAVMLERAGDGLCTLNLGNLLAGERAAIRYRFAQLLRFEQGDVRIALPTVIAPRYGDPAEAGLAAHQEPVTDLAASYPLSLAIDLEGEVAGGRVESPSHRIDVVRVGNGVRVSIAGAAWLDRDFVLAVRGLGGRTLASVERDGDGFVALASFCVDAAAARHDLPLALKLVVDCSGSMAGDSIDAARRALHRVLMGLDRGDRFSLTRFGSSVAHETRGLVAADAASVRHAADALGRMQADMGGTEMEAALRAVVALPSGGAACDMLVVTDGEVWNVPGLLKAAASARHRVFVVGIGSAPAEGVLKRIAEASGGACEFVAPGEDVEGAILRTFARMRSLRVATAEVTWPAVPAWTVPLPAGLFAGDTLHALAGFATLPDGEASLALASHEDTPPLRAVARLAVPLGAGDTLARVAAARRLPALDAAAALGLALRYRLLTDRTNLLVVADRAEKAKDLPALARVAQMHAAGWHGIGSVAAVRQCRMAPARFLDIDGSKWNPTSLGSIEFCALDGPAGSPIAALLDDGLSAAWQVPLFDLADAGYAAQEVVDALLAVLAGRALPRGSTRSRPLERQLRRWAATSVNDDLRERIEALLDGPLAAEAPAALAWIRARAAPVPAF